MGKGSMAGTAPALRFTGAVAAAALVAGLLVRVSGLAAEANAGLITELKAQNAHHFAKPLALPKAKTPPAIERDWEDRLTRTSWALKEGPLSVSVTLTKGGPPDGLLFQSPVVTLSVEGKEVLRVEGSESFPDNPIFLVQIAEMDPGNPYAEVVFSTYTGGAHCCSDTRILTSARDGKSWREIQVGQFDGAPLGVRDLDGDGRYEFAMRDNAFLYTYGCYACSTAPYHVLGLDGGKMVDISGDPAFRNRHVESLRHMIESADEGMDANGFLAGYVAQKIRLGEGAQAWKLMLKYYDRKSDWGLESCKVKLNDAGECPTDKTITLSFPESLERFFKETGYELKK